MILYCLARSSKDSIGESRRDTVRKAAKLAVYEAMMMNPKSHQVAATNLPDKFRGASPPPIFIHYKLLNGTNSLKTFSLF